MQIKKLIGMFLSGFGAIAGINMVSGCSEDVSEKPVVKLTDEQIKACCGEDDGSAKFESCIRSYQNTGVCSSTPKPEPPAPKPDDPAPKPDDPAPKPDEQIKACCGDDDGSDSYKACVESYKEVNRCLVPSIYGPAPSYPSDRDIEECCGYSDNFGYDECAKKFNDYCADKTFHGMSIEACVEDYVNNPNCPFMMPDKPVYGIVPVDDEAIKECCGEDDGSNRYRECVEAYKTTEFCPSQTIYGAPSFPDEGDIADCCGDSTDPGYAECAEKFNNYCADRTFHGMAIDECVNEYKIANACDMVVADYGMPSVPSEKDIEKCCGEDDGSDEYKKCVSSYAATGICPNMSSTVYGMPSVPSEEDIAKCCGEDDGSDEYKKCVSSYTKTNKCPNVSSTVYGMPPIPVE